MRIMIVTTENENMNETGFGSMSSCLSVQTALQTRYAKVIIKSCTSEQDLEDVLLLSPDIIVPAVKFILTDEGQEIWLSEYFKEAGITYSGSVRDVLEYDSNKILAKNKILSTNIITAGYTSVTPENMMTKENENIPYPQFLKPLNAANGNGIDVDSVVNNHEEFVKKSETLFANYGNTAMSEKYLSGREFTVAVVHSTDDNKYVIAPIEIIPPLNENNIRILGENVKNNVSEELRPITDKLERKQLEKMAVDCFVALGARDYGQVDIKMDEDGICNFMEINLVPGMAEGSSHFTNCLEMDKELNYANIITSLVTNAVAREAV